MKVTTCYPSITYAFFRAVQVALVASAIGKLAGVSMWEASARVHDPLFTFLTERYMIVGAALIELGVVLYLSWQSSIQRRASAVIWLSTLFLIYRMGLWNIGFHGYCKCLGHWTTWLHLSERQTDIIAQAMIAFMLVGSVLISVCSALSRERTAGRHRRALNREAPIG
jgi:hypothetical protein